MDLRSAVVRPLVGSLALALLAATFVPATASAQDGSQAQQAGETQAEQVVLPSQVRPTAEPETTAAESKSDPRMRRIAGATQLTRGCVDKRTKAISHRKSGKACGKRTKPISFTPKNAQTVCLQPSGTVKLSKSRAACARSDGFQVHALGNHKNLYCVRPGKAIRWVPYPGKCTKSERRYTLRNTPPSDITLDGGTVSEDVAVGGVVGELTAVDPDKGDAHRFRLVGGKGSQDNASVRLDGTTLRTRVALDHEQAQTLSIRVRTADARKRRFEKILTLRIGDAAEAPTGLELNGTSVEENRPAGALVGKVHATDGDKGDVLSYSLVAGAGDTDNALFALEGTELLTAAVFDHEEKAERSVRIRVTDRTGLTQERAFTITVVDVNDAPQKITLSSDEIVENAAAGTRVGDLLVDDVDPALPYAFTLVSGAGDDDNARFAIKGGALVSTDEFDFESEDTLRVRVRVTDAAGESATSSLVVHVLDGEEAPTDLTFAGRSVPENAAAGTVVGRLGAADPDRGEKFTYSFGTGAGDGDNALFAVVGDELHTVAVLDHEEKATRTVRLTVTDTTGRTFSKQFDVTVVDVNDAPHGLDLDSDTVVENSAVGTTVGSFEVDDVDAGAPYTFALTSGAGNADNGLFRIVGDELRTAYVLDHEDKATRSVRVRVTDDEGLTFTTALTVRVTDVNEAPSQLRLSDDAVDENSLVGTAVGTLLADDPDADDLTYALTRGAGDTDNALFEIVGDQLRTSAVLDHEQQATRSIRVTASDPEGLDTTETWTITVTNLDEAPGAPQLSNATVAENAADALVGRLSAADEDSGDTQTFSLVSGTGDADNALFAIVGDELRTVGALDHEQSATRSVRVRVTDSTRLSAEASFTISVNDVNEAPHSFAIDGTEVDENAPNALVGTVGALDPEGNALVWSLVPGFADNALFRLDGRELRTAVPLDHEQQDTRSVRVRVTDGIHLVEYPVTVTVRDVNDAPTALGIDATSIKENLTGAVGTLSASDQDADTLTYTLVAGDDAGDNGDFTIVGDELRTVRDLDFEAGARRYVRVQVSDGKATLQKAFEITVVDVDEAPGEPALSGTSVDENAAGAVIGTIAASDPERRPLTYGLAPAASGNDNALFEVIGDELRTKVALDFEQEATRRVEIVVIDGALSSRKTFTITVRDRNDAPTAITLSNLRLRQDAEVGDVVGTLTATDQDATSAHVFSNVSLAGPNSGFSYFTVVGNEVRVAKDLSTLPLGLVGLTLRVDDPSATPGPAQSYSQLVILTLLAPRQVTLSPATLAENAPTRTRVGDLAYLDGLYSGTVDFALPAGEEDNADFEVDGSELRSTRSFDHETTPTRTVLVKVAGAGVSFTEEIVVTVTDVDEAPSVTTLSHDSVVENVPNAVVGTLSASDPEGETVTFALAPAGIGNDNHRFAVVGNELRAQAGIDFEANPTQQVEVVASAGTGAAAVKDTPTVLTVKVLDGNDVPTAITLSEDEVLSSMPSGTEVGRLDVTDEDSGGTRTYAFASGGNPAGLFAIDGDLLRTDARLLSHVGTHDVELVVTDTWKGTTLTHRQTVTVTVTADTSLTLAPTAPRVQENEGAGTVVTVLSAAGGTAPYTYTLVAGDDDFALSAGGALTTRTSFDFETKKSYPIMVRVEDADGRRWEIARTVAITNVVEPMTHTVTGKLYENDAAAALTVTFANPDDAPFSLATDVELDPATTAVFNRSDAGTTMTLTVKAALNFESRQTVPLKFSYGATVVNETVEVQDVNEPTTAYSSSALSVAASTPVGTEVLTLSPHDPDGRKPELVDISVPGTDSGAGLFEVVRNGVRVKSSLAGLSGSLELRLAFRDTWGDPAFPQNYEFIRLIYVGPGLSLPSERASVQENTAGAFLTSLAASGGAPSYTYSLVDPADAALFSLTSLGTLSSTGPFDHEEKAQYQVKVRVTDSQGAMVDTTVTVDVGDVNEAPSPIVWDGASDVAENSAPGVLGTARATDPDQRSTLTYSLPGAPAGLVIDSATGVVSTTRGFDHETEPELSFTVRVTDGEFAVTKVVTIAVTDVSEAPTRVFVRGGASVPENTSAGRIGTLDGTDPEGQPLTYSLVGGAGATHNSEFTIVGDELRAGRAFDHEDEPKLSIRVRATDPSGKFVEAAIEVDVTDVNEAPVVRDAEISVDEYTGVGTDLVRLAAVDPDAGDTQAWSVSDPMFGFSGTDPQMLVNTQVLSDRALETNTFTVAVTLTDRGGLTGAGTVTVNLVPGKPKPQADQFSGLTGNVSFTSPTSVLTNDRVRGGEGPLKVVPATIDNEKVWAKIDEDGFFTATPKAFGDSRATQASFPYTVVSATGKEQTSQVTLHTSTRAVWFFQDVGTGTFPGDGTDRAPFDDTIQLSASGNVARALAGDDFSFAAGTYSPLALKTDQRVFGPSVALPGPTGQPDLRPAALTGTATIGAANGRPALTLASGTSVAGVVIQGGVGGVALETQKSGSATVESSSVIDGTNNAAVVGSGLSGTMKLKVLAPVSARAIAGRPGISLDGLGEISFQGGLDVEAGSTALSAVGVGVSVTGASNDLTSASGDALSITGTTGRILAAGIDLRRVSAPVGRVRAEAGAMAHGDLVVRGGNVAQVVLRNLGTVTLENMQVTNSTGDGVRATGLLGPLTLRGSTVTNPADAGVAVSSSDDVSVQNTAFSTSLTTGATRDGVRVETAGASTSQVSVTGSTFKGFLGDAVQVSASDTSPAKVTVTLRGNTMQQATNLGRGFLVHGAGNGWTGKLQARIEDNTVESLRGFGVALTASGAGFLDALVQNNHLGTQACAEAAVGVLLDAEDRSSLKASVRGNNVPRCATALESVALTGTPTISLIQHDNTHAAADESPVNPAQPQASWTGITRVLAQAGTTCTDLKGNTGNLRVTGLSAAWKYVDAPEAPAVPSATPLLALQGLNPALRALHVATEFTATNRVTSCPTPDLN